MRGIKIEGYYIFFILKNVTKLKKLNKQNVKKNNNNIEIKLLRKKLNKAQVLFI